MASATLLIIYLSMDRFDAVHAMKRKLMRNSMALPPDTTPLRLGMILEDMGRIKKTLLPILLTITFRLMVQKCSIRAILIPTASTLSSMSCLVISCGGNVPVAVGAQPHRILNLKTMPRSKEPPKWKRAIKECAILFQLSSEQRLFLLKARRKMSSASALKIRTRNQRATSQIAESSEHCLRDI